MYKQPTRSIHSVRLRARLRTFCVNKPGCLENVRMATELFLKGHMPAVKCDLNVLHSAVLHSALNIITLKSTCMISRIIVSFLGAVHVTNLVYDGGSRALTCSCSVDYLLISLFGIVM